MQLTTCLGCKNKCSPVLCMPCGQPCRPCHGTCCTAAGLQACLSAWQRQTVCVTSCAWLNATQHKPCIALVTGCKLGCSIVLCMPRHPHVCCWLVHCCALAGLPERLPQHGHTMPSPLAQQLTNACCTAVAAPAGLPAGERLAEAERARDDAVQKLDSHKRAAARSEREWELERQQLQVNTRATTAA
jgi:hypothetical protein